jgi:hypothetical protein
MVPETEENNPCDCPDNHGPSYDPQRGFIVQLLESKPMLPNYMPTLTIVLPIQNSVDYKENLPYESSGSQTFASIRFHTT